MFNKIISIFLGLIFSFIFNSGIYASDYIHNEYDTVNKLAILCNGNDYQLSRCLAYLMGYIDALNVADIEYNYNKVTLTVNQQKVSQVSALTIIRVVNKLISQQPEIGDADTSAILSAIFNKLGIIEFKKI